MSVTRTRCFFENYDINAAVQANCPFDQLDSRRVHSIDPGHDSPTAILKAHSHPTRGLWVTNAQSLENCTFQMLREALESMGAGPLDTIILDPAANQQPPCTDSNLTQQLRAIGYNTYTKRLPVTDGLTALKRMLPQRLTPGSNGHVHKPNRPRLWIHPRAALLLGALNIYAGHATDDGAWTCTTRSASHLVDACRYLCCWWWDWAQHL
jgi:hypothetical protein